MPDIGEGTDGKYHYVEVGEGLKRNIEQPFAFGPGDVERMGANPELLWGLDYHNVEAVHNSEDVECANPECRLWTKNLRGEPEAGDGSLRQFVENLVVGVSAIDRPGKPYVVLVECPGCGSYTWSHAVEGHARLIKEIKDKQGTKNKN